MLGIVFPHQCFAEIPANWNEVWFVRHDIGYGGKHTTVADFHIARKIFLRVCERSWIALARKRGISVRIIPRSSETKHEGWATKDAVEIWNPVDHMLEAEIRKKCPRATLLDTPAFLLTNEEALTTLGTKEHDSHAAFYASMRTRLNILMTLSGGPEGGKFRFDTENREAIGAGVHLPDWEKELKAREGSQKAEIAAAAKEVLAEEKGGHGSLGEWTGQLVFPTSHAAAKSALTRFCKTRLENFGRYQDAILAEEDFLFHSVISAPMNAGLLTPDQVLETVLAWKGKVPLASLEGFIAQVLGWREFMRAVYLKRPTAPPNRLKHGRRLGHTWYEGKTGLLPVDTAIQRLHENAYLHHIERLMIVGNAMFLCEIRPTDVYRWFMEMFADSYDWVMVGNVYYMSQWASDAITTKPYISSSAYVRRMSNYKAAASDGTANNWSADWDALYWNTVRRLAPLIRRNYRLAAQVSFWEKKTASEKRAIQERAKVVLGRL